MTSDQAPRRIRSFVKRQGRITPGQQAAVRNLLSQYGLNLEQGEVDLVQSFGRDAPVALEIGCGNGDAMIEMAQQHPEWNFIGVEVYEPGVGRLLANVEKHGLQHVRVCMHDAVEVLRQNISDASLSRVMIYFPDPWHKKRHNKRRLVQPEFVALLVQKLVVGGELHMATDWADYAEQMLEVANQAPALQNTAPDGGYVPRPDFRPLTKFEQRGQRLGHGVWDLIYTRTA